MNDVKIVIINIPCKAALHHHPGLKDVNRTFKTGSEFWSQGPHVVAYNACIVNMPLYLLHEI